MKKNTNHINHKKSKKKKINKNKHNKTKHKITKNTHTGGNKYGTINNPTIPNNEQEQTITIVTDFDFNADINNQTILEISNVKTYEDLFTKIQSKFNESILYEIVIFSSGKRLTINETNFSTDLLFNPSPKCISIYSAKKMNSMELYDYIFKSSLSKHLFLLSVQKPIATFDSTTKNYGLNKLDISTTVMLNWNRYDELDKNNFIHSIVCKLNKNRKNVDNLETIIPNDFSVMVDPTEKKSTVYFYLKTNLEKLCEIFGYSLDEALQFILLDNFVHEDKKKMAFIYIAFGDLTDIKKDTNQYNINNAKRKFNKEFIELFNQYQKISFGKIKYYL
jgi:hypothetical protein